MQRPIHTHQATSLSPPSALSQRLAEHISQVIHAQAGWLGFDEFMNLALYTPGLGYYSRADRQFGRSPRDGSDFVTAPELSPLFGQALGRQVAQALAVTQTTEVWEFGAGSGALAAQLLSSLHQQGHLPQRYVIVELSAPLRQRQQQTLAEHVPQWLERVTWVDHLPASLAGVVVGNEVLDAMPVKLLYFDGQNWFERGVSLNLDGAPGPVATAFCWANRLTHLRPPVAGPFMAGTQLEIQPIAEAFMATLAQSLERGAAFFMDYGFPEHEFFHPQRVAGTLMCHQAHRSDAEPLIAVGDKDITAHVNFTSIALAAQEAGLNVLGYTSQANFLINCGLLDDLQHLTGDAQRPARSSAQLLLLEHEMGELFKVLGLARGEFDAMGFQRGDRSHTL